MYIDWFITNSLKIIAFLLDYRFDQPCGFCCHPLLASFLTFNVKLLNINI